MAPFMSRKEFDRAGKEIEEQAKGRRTSQPPEDPTPGLPFPPLKEGMAQAEKKLAEEASHRRTRPTNVYWRRLSN